MKSASGKNKQANRNTWRPTLSRLFQLTQMWSCTDVPLHIYFLQDSAATDLMGGGGFTSSLFHSLLHCELASCGAVYCNRSCLWVCVFATGGWAGGVRTILQPARVQCLRLSESFFLNVIARARSTRLTAIISWTIWVSRYQNVSILNFNGSNDNGSGDDNWSYKTCKAQVKSSSPTNQHPAFYRPDALPVAQLTEDNWMDNCEKNTKIGLQLQNLS